MARYIPLNCIEGRKIYFFKWECNILIKFKLYLLSSICSSTFSYKIFELSPIFLHVTTSYCYSSCCYCILMTHSSDLSPLILPNSLSGVLSMNRSATVFSSAKLVFHILPLCCFPKIFMCLVHFFSSVSLGF